MNQPLAYVHPQAKIAPNVVIEPFVNIEKNVIIEEGTWIGSNVTIMEGARIGKNCRIFPGAVISAVPQDLKFDGEETIVKIGNNVTIREFVTINRGTKANNETVIGKGATGSGDNTVRLGNTSVTNVNTSGTITAGAITIPNTDGTTGQVLSTDGSGALSWTTPSSGAATHAIGDSYGGGIVFYVWDNGAHGLIVAKDEIGSLGPANFTSTLGVTWAKTTTTFGAYRSGLGGGEANTNLMIAKTTNLSQWYNYAQSTTDFYSAFLAQQYRRILQANEVRYGDWYLPSRGELEYLYTNRDNIAGSGYDPTHTYWSSTETNGSYAYILATNGTGTTNTGSGPGSNTWSHKDDLHFVLPIRSF